MTATPETIRVTDTAEEIEARTRRLMAERAALPPTWQTRRDRLRLLGLIDDLLDEWEAARS